MENLKENQNMEVNIEQPKKEKYISPTIEVIEIRTEKGYALTDLGGSGAW